MKKTILRFIGLVLIICIIGIGVYSAPIVATGYSMYKEAVSKTSLEEAVNKVKGSDNYIELKDISDEFAAKVVESEDKRFFEHKGVDIKAIIRAAYRSMREQSFAEGGSTITQQVGKNLYFSFDKKLERKVAEVFVAADLEKMLSKEEILELYLNISYFGEGCYGVKEAAKHYYGVSPKSLSSEQTAALVFTLKRPNDYNPNAYQR